MAAYLIDFENVKSDGIRGILSLTEKDTVVIFYSQNADSLTFEAMDMIFSTKACVRKFKIIHGGKNSLDFQLSTYLGYLIHEGTDRNFYIISNDKGFQHVIEFWKKIFNYEGYVYSFPTIGDAHNRQIRFDNASAKERARMLAEENESGSMKDEPVSAQEPEEEIAEEEIEGSSESLPEETDTEEFFAEDDDAQTVSLAEERVYEEAAAQETDAEEPENGNDSADAEESSYVSTGEPETAVIVTAEENVKASETLTDAPEEKEAPKQSLKPAGNITTITSADGFVTVVHEDGPVKAAVPGPVPEAENTRIPDELVARQIAAAVGEADMKVTIVDNSVTVHTVEGEIRREAASESGDSALTAAEAVPAEEEKPEEKKSQRTRRSRSKKSTSSAETEEKKTAGKSNEKKTAGKQEEKKAEEKKTAGKQAEKKQEEKKSAGKPEETANGQEAKNNGSPAVKTAQTAKKSSSKSGNRKKNADAKEPQPDAKQDVREADLQTVTEPAREEQAAQPAAAVNAEEEKKQKPEGSEKQKPAQKARSGKKSSASAAKKEKETKQNPEAAAGTGEEQDLKEKTESGSSGKTGRRTQGRHPKKQKSESAAFKENEA